MEQVLSQSTVPKPKKNKIDNSAVQLWHKKKTQYDVKIKKEKNNNNNQKILTENKIIL